MCNEGRKNRMIIKMNFYSITARVLKGLTFNDSEREIN